jgi:hypothetical protein
LFAREHPIVERLRRIDPDRLTPLEALNLISALSAEARGRAAASAIHDEPSPVDGERA